MRTSNFALRLQPSLLEAARNLAEAEGVALNQLINTAVAQMVAAHSASNYISIRAKRANLPHAMEILNKAGAGNPPLREDELPVELPARRSARKQKVTTANGRDYS